MGRLVFPVLNKSQLPTMHQESCVWRLQRPLADSSHSFRSSPFYREAERVTSMGGGGGGVDTPATGGVTASPRTPTARFTGVLFISFLRSCST